MEHEVNVPSSVGPVRAALAEPERVARCVPGLQLDGAEGSESAESTASAGGAGRTGNATGPVEGRLRVRVGNSTITYRGSLTVTPRDEEFTVKASGTEARGTGSVRLNLTVVPKSSEEGEGTRLVCSGTLKADGRIADVEPKTAASAGHRLLERFAKALGESIRQDPPQTPAEDRSAGAEAAPERESGASGGIGEPGDNDRVIPGIPAPDSRESRTSAGTDEETGDKLQDEDQAQDEAGAEDKGEAKDKDKAGAEAGAGDQDRDQERDQGQDQDERAPGEQDETPERGGIFGTEIPPSSLDPLHDDEPLDEAEVEAAAEAEAAHARRTMIGRSAEEVDHAPPRGRYAPVPLPEPIANSAALRWVAPAAAAVVAGAVVIGRALRRRR